MTLFELAHFGEQKPFYEQGFIVLPHLAALGFNIGPGGEITSIYSYFVIGVLHIISARIIGLGGIYHAIFGPEKLEETAYAYLFSYNWSDRFRVTAILGANLGAQGLAVSLFFSKGAYLKGLYDTWSSGGGDIRLVKDTAISLNPYVLFRYLGKAPGAVGGIISINNLEDILGAHYWVGIFVLLGGVFHILTKPVLYIKRGFTWSGEAYLAYSLSALSLCGFTSSIYGWYNNTVYPSEFYGPTAGEASQAQRFTFAVRDHKLGVKLAASQGLTSLGKYLMRSPTGSIILSGETMRFWSVQSGFMEPLSSSKGLDVYKLQSDIQNWEERRAAEYMTHAPLGSLNSVGGVRTEINAINFLSPRSWLTACHWVLSYFILVGHWWHGGRSKSSALSNERGLSRIYEPVLYMRPID